MPVLTVVLTAEVDGHPINNSPFYFTSTLAEFQSLNVQKAVDAVGSFVAIPTLSSLGEIDWLLLSNPDAQLIYQFQNQGGTGGITVPAGGLIVLIGKINSGATTNVLVNNSNGNSPATILGFAAGP